MVHARLPWWALRYDAAASVDPAFAGVIDDNAEAEVSLLGRLLQLEEGDRVLDVGCGAGRHAILLQERGHAVTAVDLSPGLLALAQGQWSERNGDRPGPAWLPGDMRWLPACGPFDAALLMDHALGVFDDDEEHLRVLVGIAEQLRSGGRIALTLLNPYWWSARLPLTRHFPPGSITADSDVVRTWRFDALRGRVEDRIVAIGPEGREELPAQSLRAWTPAEVVALLKAAGFGSVRVMGSDGWRVPTEPRAVSAQDSVHLWVTATL